MKLNNISTNVLGTTQNIKKNNKENPKTIEKSAPAGASSSLESAGRAMVSMGKSSQKEVVDAYKTLAYVQEYVKDLDDPVQKAKSKDLIKAIKLAIKEKEFDKLTRVQDAIDVLEGGENYKKLEVFAKELSDKYSSNDGIYTKNALNEILDVFSDKPVEITKNEKGAFVANVAGCGTFSARAKGRKSVVSKLRNKIIDLKDSMPEDVIKAGYMVGDAQGVRLNLDSIDFSNLNDEQLAKKADEIIATYKKRNLSKTATNEILEKNKDFFLDFIKGKKLEPEVEKVFLEVLSYNQTYKYVDNLCEAIKSGKIRITEINNYSGKNGVPYLNSTEIERITEAYDVWYKSIKDSGIVGYELFNKGEEDEYLFQNGAVFKADLPIISTTILSKKDIKKYKKALKANGYTATQFNIVTKDGFQEEFQLRGKIVDKIAESEHIVYDINSEKDTVVDKVYDKIKISINKMKEKDENLDKYNKYYQDVFMACRKRELGIPANMPDLKDYVKFDNLTEEDYKLLSTEGIDALHKQVEELKNKNKEKT